MTLLDGYASLRHYASHVLPAWRAVPARGVFWTRDPDLAAVLRREAPGEDIRPLPGGTLPRPILVGSHQDAAVARRRRAPAVALMDHGTGQSYGGDPRMASHPSYAGGGGHEGVGLFLAPNVHAALRWSARYPGAAVHVIGATRLLPPPESGGTPLLVLSFHWTGAIPELAGALAHYRPRLLRLAGVLPLAGHAHPRYAATAARVFTRAGIPFIPDLQEVAARATVYAVDNSSTLWELGLTRPVLALNAPWYRRRVEHGLRFWSHVPLQVDGPDELVVAGGRILDRGESPEERARRVGICRDVLPYLDGAERAGTILAGWLQEGPPPVGRAWRPADPAGVSQDPEGPERFAGSFLEGQSPGGNADELLAAR